MPPLELHPTLAGGKSEPVRGRVGRRTPPCDTKPLEPFRDCRDLGARPDLGADGDAAAAAADVAQDLACVGCSTLSMSFMLTHPERSRSSDLKKVSMCTDATSRPMSSRPMRNSLTLM
jgi:hypothetical protein